MRVRLKDIAEALDLSIGTVNAVLHNRPNFTATTRERVLKKAEELGYRPNWVARSLVLQSTKVIGVVVPYLSISSFFPDVLMGIDKIAFPARYHLMISSTYDDPEREITEVGALLNKQVDGLIIASSQRPEARTMWEMLEKTKTPFVLIDRFYRFAPYIGADNEKIGYLATRHLIEQSYHTIAHLSRQSVVTGVGRYRGYVRALRESGFPVRRNHVVDGAGVVEGGYEAAKRLLQLRPRPDAIFAASDAPAIGAMLAVEECGLRLPADFGLIGVGATRYGEYLRVPLSTVEQHRLEIGVCAASLLLRMIEGEPAPKDPVFLEPTVIVRESSRRTGDASQEPSHPAFNEEEDIGPLHRAKSADTEPAMATASTRASLQRRPAPL